LVTVPKDSPLLKVHNQWYLDGSNLGTWHEGYVESCSRFPRNPR
jgi:hypothetical protein